MFSVQQKREIADAVQRILRGTDHPELPGGEISFHLHVDGASPWSWADIKNNAAVPVPDVNEWNERNSSRVIAPLDGSTIEQEFAKFDARFKPGVQ